MQGDSWNDFAKSGRVSDYLKYVDSARNTTYENGEFSGRMKESNRMESMQHAGKSDGNGAFGRSGW